MTKEEIHTEVSRLLFEDSSELSRDEYRDLLEDVIDDCKTSIRAMNEEDLNENN